MLIFSSHTLSISYLAAVMAVDEDMNVECCSVTSLRGVSHQEPAIASTSQLVDSSTVSSHSLSLINPDVSNSHSTTRGVLNVPPKLEHSLWTRFKPLVRSLEVSDCP